MNGMMLLGFMTSSLGAEVVGEDDWVAARLVLHMPLFGIEVAGDWLCSPIEELRDG